MDKINKNKLDPVTIYATNKVTFMLAREELDVPARREGNEDENGDEQAEETEEEYRERLIKVSQSVSPTDQ